MMSAISKATLSACKSRLEQQARVDGSSCDTILYNKSTVMIQLLYSFSEINAANDVVI